MEEKKEEKKSYNKWKSRRWLIALYVMIVNVVVLFGNKMIQLPSEVLIAWIGFTNVYLMIFTGYETKRKMNSNG